MPTPMPRLRAGTDPLGGDRRARGIPSRSQLDLRTRMAVDLSGAADLGLRTFVATVVAATLLPLGLRRKGLGPDLAHLDFYSGLGAAGDSEASFPRPLPGHRVQTTRAGRLLGTTLHGARVETLSFESRFRTRNPAPEVRGEYESHIRNRTAWAQHWRHVDGPRPTLLVIHGFMGSAYSFNSAFFSLPWFFAQGYDVALFTLPFHGHRKARCAPYSGSGLFAGGVAHLSEAMGHAVHDLRVLIDHLEAVGVEQVGVTGLSLGGYTTALLVGVEDRLKVAVPNAAVTEMSSLMDDWFPMNLLLEKVAPSRGMDFDRFAAAAAYHSPLSYAPRVPKERLLVIGGLGDRLAPPRQSELLWEHWGRPRLHWYPGNHILHVNRGAYLGQMKEFFGEVGFRGGSSPPNPRTPLLPAA